MAVFCLMFVVATLLALVVPRLDWRRRITHRLATLALPVLGLRVAVTGLEHLPPDQLRRGREPCQLPRRHHHEGGAAASLLLRDQAGGGFTAAGRLPAEAHRLGVRRPPQRGRPAARCAARIAGRRVGPRAGVLPGRHVRRGAGTQALPRRGVRRRRARRDAGRAGRDPRRAPRDAEWRDARAAGPHPRRDPRTDRSAGVGSRHRRAAREAGAAWSRGSTSRTSRLLSRHAGGARCRLRARRSAGSASARPGRRKSPTPRVRVCLSARGCGVHRPGVAPHGRGARAPWTDHGVPADEPRNLSRQATAQRKRTHMLRRYCPPTS